MMLSDLPREITDAIVTFLDPIGFISLSQTCRWFREIIRPRRRHFVQRLLQLETDPRYGRYTPLLEGPDPWPLPTFVLQNPYWGDALYACPGCMRLRHHRWFENRMILRIPLRKPTPTSRAANAPIESDDMGALWKRRRVISGNLGDCDMSLWRRHKDRFAFARAANEEPDQVAGHPKPVKRQYPLPGTTAPSILMDELVGLEREKRRCIPCARRERGLSGTSYPNNDQVNFSWYNNARPTPGVLVAPRRFYEDTFLPCFQRQRPLFSWYNGATHRLYARVSKSALRALLLCGFCDRFFLISEEFVKPDEVMDTRVAALSDEERVNGTWECGCLSLLAREDTRRKSPPFELGVHVDRTLDRRPYRMLGPYHRNPNLEWHRMPREHPDHLTVMSPQELVTEAASRGISGEASSLVKYSGPWPQVAQKGTLNDAGALPIR